MDNLRWMVTPPTPAGTTACACWPDRLGGKTRTVCFAVYDPTVLSPARPDTEKCRKCVGVMHRLGLKDPDVVAKRRRRWRRALIVIAAIAVFVTGYSLMQLALEGL